MLNVIDDEMLDIIQEDEVETGVATDRHGEVGSIKDVIT
jgi:hypothetical protein